MDLDNDGVLDLYSGAYDTNPIRKFAPAQFFKGKKDSPLDFEAPIPLKTLSGELPNLKGLQRLIDPETKRARLPTVTPLKSKPHLVDLNGDGNLDLIYGEKGGYFAHFTGSASTGIEHFANQAELLKDQNGNFLKVDYSAAPHLIDWDGDHDLDILSGNGQGGVYFAENIGDPKNPKWKAFTEWLPPTSSSNRTNGRSTIQNTRKKLQPNSETTVNVVDYNNDGKLDLLVGDRTILETPLDHITDAEFEVKEAEYRAMQDAYGPDQKAMDDYYNLLDNSDKSPESKKAIAAALDLADKLSDEIYDKKLALKNSFKTAKRAGFVWVFLQK